MKYVYSGSLTGKCAKQKFKNFCSSSLWTCLHNMVILRSLNKIIDFFMILAWVWAFKSWKSKFIYFPFEPVLHSNPIFDRIHLNKIKNWITLILNSKSLCNGAMSKLSDHLSTTSNPIVFSHGNLVWQKCFHKLIFPPGYKIFWWDRIISTERGGVFIAVKENYDVFLLPDTVTDTKLLWAKVDFEKSKPFINLDPGKMEEFSRSLDFHPKN